MAEHQGQFNVGMRDSKTSLQSKKGHQRVLDALKGAEYELVVWNTPDEEENQGMAAYDEV
jgi:hypothetical protein